MNSKTVKVKAVSTEDSLLTVWLSDGRILSLPLAWYPSLAKADAEERDIWQPSGAGRGIHWPALDYDLSIAGLIAGLHEHPGALACTQKTRKQNQVARKPASRTRLKRRSVHKVAGSGLSASA